MSNGLYQSPAKRNWYSQKNHPIKVFCQAFLQKSRVLLYFEVFMKLCDMHCDIGNLESYEAVCKTYRGISKN